MKFCAVICEYNPFHNGHRYQIEKIRELSCCDKILCLMSGNFTQRGEIAILDKYTRARHAIENGADIVLELPTGFSVAPAEIFAGGAVHLLSTIPTVTALAFGCESGTREDFLLAASAINFEDREFKSLLKENMKNGGSFVKARTETVLRKNPSVNEALLTSPNNILGTEYCRAILKGNCKIEPLPIPRVGPGYSDEELRRDLSSASAIRAALREEGMPRAKLIRGNVPENVFRDLRSVKENSFKTAVLCALLSAGAERVKEVTDCAEGLENRLISLAASNPDYDGLLEKVVSKRYTLSRLKRLLAQNFLGIRRKDVRSFLTSPLYLNVLAVKKEGHEELFAALGQAKIPFLARRSDAQKLRREALLCLETDARAAHLFGILEGRPQNPYETLMI